jgi:hypothetical protein
MAYFANIDSDNRVVNVIVVADSDITDEQGVEREELGVEFCKQVGEGRWIQTEMDGSIRKSYASIGSKYLESLDAFEPHREYESWTLNEDSWEWEPPVPAPAETGPWDWNEETKGWEKAE